MEGLEVWPLTMDISASIEHMLPNGIDNNINNIIKILSLHLKASLA